MLKALWECALSYILTSTCLQGQWRGLTLGQFKASLEQEAFIHFAKIIINAVSFVISCFSLSVLLKVSQDQRALPDLQDCWGLLGLMVPGAWWDPLDPHQTCHTSNGASEDLWSVNKYTLCSCYEWLCFIISATQGFIPDTKDSITQLFRLYIICNISQI